MDGRALRCCDDAWSTPADLTVNRQTTDLRRHWVGLSGVHQKVGRAPITWRGLNGSKGWEMLHELAQRIMHLGSSEETPSVVQQTVNEFDDEFDDVPFD